MPERGARRGASARVRMCAAAEQEAGLAQRGAARLTLLALCLALSLMLFFVELRLPLVAAVPGFKLGLANIVTVAALRLFHAREALLLLVLRIVLGAAFAGSLPALSFSLAGGLLALSVGVLLLRAAPRVPLALLGIAGALSHNVGQLLAASFWLGTLDVFYYAPALFFLAVFTGSATGFLAQEVLRRLPWRNKKISQKL
ncbi:Gx transporter family protein [uncultured Selenomonas sp.]|uniref:Gx transporter family protein n=1 Tax=uncultured Selenomonas sp. TaxID=159275 RepID=UPI0028DB7016|nr:Gx transporter family protein [uncultured Selenomonas sp.]